MEATSMHRRKQGRSKILTAEQEDALFLDHAAEELDVKALADKYGISVSTIYATLHRVVRRRNGVAA